jgi:uncharacterized integral membrane protein (TIGR00698 family)
VPDIREIDRAAETGDAGAPADRSGAMGEDWVAVWIAAAIIVLVLAGVRTGVPAFDWATTGDLGGSVLSGDNLARALRLGLLLLLPAAGGARLLGVGVLPFSAGFVVLYALGCLSQVLAGAPVSAALGLEYVIFALAIGLLLGHATRLRARLGDAVQAEYFIKIGLVVLGAGILFTEILQAGLLGITQALVVVLSVWFVCFHLARRLRVDDELAAMLSTAVAICGVSAAIAACGAIQGDRRKLSYVTSLVLVVAVPMMVVMPWIVRATGMNEVVAGAWLGGTLDTSAAVVAAGELVSEPARNAAVVVKLSQNVLIGVAALALTVWWTLRRGLPGTVGMDASALWIIWERFPKFVLGFLVASLVFSFVLPSGLVADAGGLLRAVRTTWFAMAFVAIGLETSLGALVRTGDGRPALAFLGGQAFNVIVTLLAAYLLFGGVLLPAPVFD